MTLLSLPVIAPWTSDNSDASIVVTPVDRSKPYPSCEWLEGGLAFNRRSLHACLIVHHGRGFPHLVDFNGGEIPVNRVLAARNEIIRQNQNDGARRLRGVRHLVTKQWPEPKYKFDTIGHRPVHALQHLLQLLLPPDPGPGQLRRRGRSLQGDAGFRADDPRRPAGPGRPDRLGRRGADDL